MICACCAGTFLAFVPALSRGDEQVVPISQEPHHQKRFENEYLRLLEVVIGPGDATLMHRHDLDYFGTVAQGGVIRNEKFGEQNARVGVAATGDLLFVNCQETPLIHRIVNLGQNAVVNIAAEIAIPKPHGFDVGTRANAPQYSLEIDNARVRAWRLKLEPGKAAAPTVQAGPGLRTILLGDAITETVDGGGGSVVPIRAGQFAYQPPGATRAVRNSGKMPLEIVEWEIR
jgi:hypothetical protein